MRLHLARVVSLRDEVTPGTYYFVIVLGVAQLPSKATTVNKLTVPVNSQYVLPIVISYSILLYRADKGGLPGWKPEDREEQDDFHKLLNQNTT